MRNVLGLALFAFALLFVSNLPLSNSNSVEMQTDNWPENDAWLLIELVSWTANESVEWDNNGGLPDPKFRICVSADGDNLDCLDTPTWDNQLILNNSWNYSIDIPDNSNVLNVTIECEDNDALNDDECDMNSDIEYWRLYAEYNWSQNPNMTIIGDGNDNSDDNWKNSESVWRLTVSGFGDEDNDGFSDNIDTCPNTSESFGNVNQTIFPGCSWGQLDLDKDGIISDLDSDPFDSRIGIVTMGSNRFDEDDQGYLIEKSYMTCRNAGIYQMQIVYNNSFNYGNQCDNDETTLSLQGNWNTNYVDANQDGIPDMQTMEWGFYPIETDTEESIQLVSDVCLQIMEFHPYVKVGQISQDGDVLVHCYTSRSSSSNSDCTTTLLSISPNSTRSLLSFEGNESNSVCNWNSLTPLRHIGGFGDFNGDDVIDFVNIDVNNGSNNCSIFLGQETSELSFYQFKIACNWANHIEIADINNDGFDDIITNREIIFMNDDGVVSRVELRHINGFALGISQIYDVDQDGDLDIVIFKSSDYNFDFGNNITRLVSYFIINSAIIDDDNDSISNTNDMVDLDSDGDGVRDSVDECDNTPFGSLVDYQGCITEQNDNANSDESTSRFDIDFFYSICAICGVVLIIIASIGSFFPTDENGISHFEFSFEQGKPNLSFGPETYGSADLNEFEHLEEHRQITGLEVEQLNHVLNEKETHSNPQLSEIQLKLEELQISIADSLKIQHLQESATSEDLKEMENQLKKVLDEKEALVDKLSKIEESSTIVQNITYNISDSAISGGVNLKKD